MAIQPNVAPGEIRPEMSGEGPEGGGTSDPTEARQQLSSTSPEAQDRLRAKASRRLLLALDDFDCLLADAPYLPDPDHEGWRAGLYPWIEDLARARQHVTEALNSLGVQHIGAQGEPLDPACHKVVSCESGGDGGTQHVSRVVRPGFRLGACVLRRAQVVVTGPPKDPVGLPTCARLISANEATPN